MQLRVYRPQRVFLLNRLVVSERALFLGAFGLLEDMVILPPALRGVDFDNLDAARIFRFFSTYSRSATPKQ